MTTRAPLEGRIQGLLKDRPGQELMVPGRRLAAVLLPLYRHNGDYGVIFTRRSETVPHHQGQMSFPGGGFENGDGTLRRTALRECEEEIGLQAAHVRVLGQLDDLLTSNSNYLVRPFVGTIPYPYPFIVDRRETASIVEVPLRFLRQHNPRGEECREFGGREVRSIFFEYQEHVIWGTTGKILKQFLDLLETLPA
jgi:8-oxo-dGTP pyrophosphatase MutT (NUDIX family)